MSLSINYNSIAANSSRHLNATYQALASSVRHLSSGLRVENAADDAAGLAIRELMRADIATYNQGIRNANDAVSLIQTADGALQIIDEKLVRMKELAMQAATGSYNSDQRMMIDNEYRAMADEINRIAKSTTFNGVYLLNGNLSGAHDGSGLEAKGALKVHFGTGNSSAEDYYYVNIKNASIAGFELGCSFGNVPLLSERLENGKWANGLTSGIQSFAVIPKGTKNIKLFLNDNGANDDMLLFTRSGQQLVGTQLSTSNTWTAVSVNAGNVDTKMLTEANGFSPDASYSSGQLNGIGGNVPFNMTPLNSFSVNGMNIGYSGNGNPSSYDEAITIDEVTEDLVFMVIGSGKFNAMADWGYMPTEAEMNETVRSIATQQEAQVALEDIDRAIVIKDGIRADLGALQNRLENTISNLGIQAENLQAAESRISDVDVAQEMTEFTRQQIKSQAAVAMLAQANSLPQMAMKLLTV